MLAAQQHLALAREMKAAHDEVRQIEPFTSRVAGFGLADAYEVARLMHEARLAEGWRPVGRKIGFTNHEMWERYGVREPIWAHIYDRTVVQVPGERIRCSLAGFSQAKIEPEIVLHLRTAPPAGAGAAEILACIDWVAFGFEIVQSHVPGWRFQAPDTVADQGLHGTLLVGPPQPLERLGAQAGGALESFSLSLSCGGEVRDRGRGSNVLGSPLQALAHLAGVLSRQPSHAPLAAGETITTGTVTMAHPVSPGETWQAELEGIALPGFAVEFVA